MDQLTLDFEPGLTERFPNIEDVLVASVYSGKKPHKTIAYDLDESPSSLTRKVKGDLEFPVSKLPALIESTEDTTIIHWLIEKFLVDSSETREAALKQLAAMVPEIQALLKAAK